MATTNRYEIRPAQGGWIAVFVSTGKEHIFQSFEEMVQYLEGWYSEEILEDTREKEVTNAKQE